MYVQQYSVPLSDCVTLEWSRVWYGPVNLPTHPSEIRLVGIPAEYQWEGISSRASPTVVDPTDTSLDANQSTNSIAFLTPIHPSMTSGIESSGEKRDGAGTPPSLLLPPPIDRGLLFKGMSSAHDRSVNHLLR